MYIKKSNAQRRELGKEDDLDRLLFDDDLNWASRKLILKGVQSYVTSWLNALRKRLQDSYKNKG